MRDRITKLTVTPAGATIETEHLDVTRLGEVQVTGNNTFVLTKEDCLKLMDLLPHVNSAIGKVLYNANLPMPPSAKLKLQEEQRRRLDKIT
jgi:hypothetical protein